MDVRVGRKRRLKNTFSPPPQTTKQDFSDLLTWTGKAIPKEEFSLGSKESLLKYVKGYIKHQGVSRGNFQKQLLRPSFLSHPNNLKFIEPILESLQHTSDILNVENKEEEEELEAKKVKLEEEREIEKEKEISKNFEQEEEIENLRIKCSLLTGLCHKSKLKTTELEVENECLREQVEFLSERLRKYEEREDEEFKEYLNQDEELQHILRGTPEQSDPKGYMKNLLLNTNKDLNEKNEKAIEQHLKAAEKYEQSMKENQTKDF